MHYIYIYIYIYIYNNSVFVTISLGGFVVDQMQYNLESAQYLFNCLITTASELREKAKVTGSKVWTIGTVRNCLDTHLRYVFPTDA